MDSSVVIQNATRDKILMGQILVDDKDLLSNLHESILGHILSFLPTKEAIQTNILSKRWIYVWTSITGLQFDDSMLYFGKGTQKEHFINFVNNTLLHLANSSIRRFSLCLSRYQYDPSQVSAWISSILERGVEKLHIQYADKVLLSSSSLFTCRSLVQLMLQMRCTLGIPNSVCLPHLQYLSISGVTFVSDSPTNSKDLIFSFPVLKVFEARGCEWSTMENVSIQVPLLQSFSISLWNSLSNESSKCSIKICATHLTNFSYEGDLEHEIVLSNPSSILNASIVIVIDEDRMDRMQEISPRGHMLLRQVHEAEHLKLWFYKDLMLANDIFTNLPAFGRLTYLQLNEVTGEALLNLLHKSPILKTLVLLHGVSKFDKDFLGSALVPPCFGSTLKDVQFGGFNVHEHELSLAKFVMGNAAMLERMTISTAFWLRYSDIDMEKVKEQLLSFPKRSSFALIEISDVSDS